MRRAAALAQLAEQIAGIDRPHPIRVAIDGIDAAGKTRLADELVEPMRRWGRPIIRASLDGFHRPRRDRYRQGADSAQGYYQDSFDYPAVKQALLEPLGPGGSRRYRTAVFDFQRDQPAAAPEGLAAADAVLLVDGIFLLRPELNAYWDWRIFVAVEFEVALARASERDRELFGSPEAALARYRQRYLPAQRQYLATVQPQQLAEVVFDNNDPENPKIYANREKDALKKGDK